jgi:hypothetical protein
LHHIRAVVALGQGAPELFVPAAGELRAAH